MATLKLLGGDANTANPHIIFFHGLSGSIDGTWALKVQSEKEYWPLWIIDEIGDAAIWAVEYEASKSNWTGHALPLEDRGQNIWHLLRDEPLLNQNEIVFVCHSMGGLVAIQVLRCIERDREDANAESFGARLRRIAFLGTPHRGSSLASTFSLAAPLLPTQAIRDLRTGSAQLRDLSGWFRKYVRNNQLLTLSLAEGLRSRLGGFLPAKVVTPESADGGFVDTPTVVDETHQTINKPSNRDNQVYKALIAFLSKPYEGNSTTTRIVEGIQRIETEFGGTRKSFESGQKRTHSVLEEIQSSIRTRAPRDSRTLGKALQEELNSLLQRRLFSEVDAVAEARTLLNEIENGEYQLASFDDRREAVAWCARILAPIDPDEASSFLSRHNEFYGELVALAHFRIRAAKGDLDLALNDIARYNTPTTRGAAYLAFFHDRGAEEANEWLASTDTKPFDLDDAALVQHLGSLHKEDQQEAALELVKTIAECRLERCAALNGVVAGIYLAGAVVEPSFEVLHRTALVSMDSVPLKDDPKSLTLRRSASRSYSRLARLAHELDLPTATELAADWAMWLDLKDPDEGEEARSQLEESLGNSDTLLRRFLWAKQCGIDLDLPAVDREIERQVALTGGSNFKHACARLAMAMAFGGKKPSDGYHYIDAHREHLERHLDPVFILGLETEMLARAGESTRARSRVADAVAKGMDSAMSARLQALIDQTEDQDGSLGSLIENFQRSGSILDLRALTAAYFEREAFSDVVTYGERLVEQSGDGSDARMLAIALYETERQEEALKVLDGFPPLKTSQMMELLRARAHFELGQLEEAVDVLDDLQSKNDFEGARLLHLQLTITSGDWAALQTFVEQQWSQREDRSALELIQAGQIAQFIGSPRGEALIRKAAETAADDPGILAACYHAATSAGWEDDASVASWIARAAELSEASDEEGPVRKVSIDQIIQSIPQWEARESRTTEQAISGQVPLFLVAHALNRSLTQMVLSQAIWNARQTDVRGRSMILTTSGKFLPTPVDARTLALDPIALLTLSYLGILEACREAFDGLKIPHETLAWLFEERTQLRFHQPSQVEAARALQRCITDWTVRVHETNGPVPEGLYREVGRTLAELLYEAQTLHDDERERIVVVWGPIWKVGSAMSVEANLGDFAQYVRSTADIIEALAERGGLTSARLEAARHAHKPSAGATRKPIPAKAILLLDDTAASLLSHSDLLNPLRRAGFEIVIPTSELEEARQLIEYEARAEEALNVVEMLRDWLANGIREGWIQLGKSSKHDELHKSQWFSHPSASMLNLVMDVDAAVVEDRFFNSHSNLSTQHGSVPIITTWTLLDALKERKAISAIEWREARAVMRQSGYVLAPVNAEELSELIMEADVSDGHLVEPAELRALRESVARVRMSDVLQLPDESPWLDEISIACIRAISQVWKETDDASVAQVRSEWLVDLGDPNLWAHRLCNPGIQLEQKRLSWFIMLILLSTGREDDAALGFRDWLETRIVKPLKKENPELFNNIIDDMKVRISELVSRMSEANQIDEVANGN